VKQLVLLLALFGLTSQAHAQKIKVRKVKGNQAIVQFTQAAPLVPGAVYELSSSSEFDEVHTGRDHLLGLDFNFGSSTVDSGTGNGQQTSVSLVGRYGWNFGNFEVGPKVQFSSLTSFGSTTSTLLIGAFGDYNLIPNAEGETFLYGLGAQFAGGQIDDAGAKRTLMDGKLGPFLKWFPYGGSFAFRADALYAYQKQSSSGFDVTISGFQMTAGIANYF
jgi:hypothetical protein